MDLAYERGPNRLLFVSGSPKQAQFIVSQLRSVLQDAVGIESYVRSENNIPRLKQLLSLQPQLVGGTSSLSAGLPKQYYDADKITVFALGLHEAACFDQLFLLPPGGKILLVNMTEESAFQAMHSLLKLGINHIHYEPYWMGCDKDTEGYDTAVSPDMFEFCPDRIQNRINIGMRSLTVSAFTAIVHAYGLDLAIVNQYVDIQRVVLTNTYKKLSLRYLESKKLKDTLQLITDGLDEAIVSFDENGSIVEMNACCVKVFGISRLQYFGKQIQEFFDLINWDNSPDILAGINEIATIKGKPFYVDCSYIGESGKRVGMFRMREIRAIQNKDEEVRKLLYQKKHGHVAKYTFDDILAKDESMDLLKQLSKRLSRTNHTVLIIGESGTGKELFAQSIHNASERSQHPFVAVNFAALPENLIESELFGYEEGAFTGAQKKGKKGLFEMAHTGTIFLDEIGDASPAVQTRLLRVLEEKEVMRIGDTKIIPVDVRVIAATNKDLKKQVESGMFRADLYYRINVFQLRIPPLRERLDSIIPFIQLFSNGRFSKASFTDGAINTIMRYNWPGNLRELRNLVDYVTIMAKGSGITESSLPNDLREMPEKGARGDVQIDFEVCCSNLDNRINMATLREILEILAKSAPPAVIGRIRILRILQARGISCSAATLRTVFGHLSVNGFVIIGKTKQGATLSPLGKQFLIWLQSGTPGKAGSLNDCEQLKAV